MKKKLLIMGEINDNIIDKESDFSSDNKSFKIELELSKKYDRNIN